MARSKEEIQKLLDQYKVDQEPNLTDQELQDRLGAYQELNGFQSKDFNRDKLVNEISHRLQQFGGAEDVGKNSQNLADIIMANGKLPSYFLNPGAYKGSPGYGQGLSDLEKAYVGVASLGTAVPSFFGKKSGGGVQPDYLLENPANIRAYQIINSLVDSGYFFPDAVNTQDDVKRLQDMVTHRQAVTKSNAQADEYLGSLQDELAKGTNAYIQGEQGRAGQYLEEQLAPEIAQSANVRGMLYSGDLANELSRGASDAFGDVQNQRVQLEQQDRDFYKNAAYNMALTKSLQAGQDLSAEIGNQRDQSRQQQEYRFQASQSDQERQLQEKLLNQQQQRALYSQNVRLKRQQDQSNKASSAGLASGIGQSIGAIAGAVYGGPVGSAVGSQAGKYAGETIGSRISH